MKNAIILGSLSDIALEIMPRLVEDNWDVWGWNRNTPSVDEFPRWNLMVIALGRVAPVGYWWENEGSEWDACVRSNVLLPMRLLRRLWPLHEPYARICFMAGSNPQKIMPGYSAYHFSKMGLLKLVEQLDAETPDATFFALGPGYVPTKIHAATLAQTAIRNERIERGGGTAHEDIYECLKWCIEQPKDIVGGRNICVSDPWRQGAVFSFHLEQSQSKMKLRRVE